MVDGEIAVLDYSCNRIFRKLLLTMSKSSIWTGRFRCKLLKSGGVNIGEMCFIGSNVSFDTLHPEYITIGDGCCITEGTKIISHFYSPETSKMYVGRVHIGKNVFIGMNSLIVKPVTIGDDVVIGAGSVVIRDIPFNEIWGGNPAKFLKKK